MKTRNTMKTMILVAGVMLAVAPAMAKKCVLGGKELAAGAPEWSNESLNFQNPADVKPFAKDGLQKKVMTALFSGESNRCKAGPDCITCE